MLAARVDRSLGLHPDAFRATGLQGDWVGPELVFLADPETVWSRNGGMGAVTVRPSATDPSGVAGVSFVEVRVSGPGRAGAVPRSGDTF